MVRTPRHRRQSLTRRVRRRTPTVLVAVVAMCGSLLVAGPASGATTLDSAMEYCLRVAARDPGGVLVFADERLRSSQVLPLRQRLWYNGRPACVRYDYRLTVARAYVWWHGLDAGHRPGTVVVAAPGTLSQWQNYWAHDMPKRRLLGTADSKVGASSMLAWKSYSSGATVGALILQRLREYTIYGGPWAGTSDSYRTLSNAAMCKAALSSPKGVYVFGDSITTRDFSGVYNALKARGYVPCIDGQWGSRVYDHLKRLQAGKIALPKNVIIALGNNDVFAANVFRRDAWRMLTLIGTGRNVVFPTVWRNKPGTYLKADQYNATSMNVVIHDMLRFHSNWKVMEWAAVVQRHPAYQSDGIHLSASGKVVRYDMYADLLDQLTR